MVSDEYRRRLETCARAVRERPERKALEILELNEVDRAVLHMGTDRVECRLRHVCCAVVGFRFATGSDDDHVVFGPDCRI